MDIDRSKENIQPLRGGRNPAHLGAALAANSDAEAARLIQLQQREHESLINDYDGPDPLDPWFSYIQWVEQCFPKHGHEGHIDKLIKECLTKFENDERYFQDRRFLRLWIKFIDYCNNPLELYQMLYNKGLGTSCSELYRAWACYCEEASDYKKADQIYSLGMQANAEPKEELELAHREFQIWCTQRLIHNDSPTKRKAASALAETRLALTTLHTVKRRNTTVVPSQRTGDSIYNHGAGVVKQNAESTNQPRSNIIVNIYDDKPGPSNFPDYPDAIYTNESANVPVESLFQLANTAENQKEVGIWTNSSNKTEKTTSKIVPANPAPFTLFEDDRLILSKNHIPYCQEDFTDFRVQIFVPDPPDSTKIPKYNKKEVYKEVGSEILEYSLEEIKSLRYRNKNKQGDSKVLANLDSNCQFGEGSSSIKNEFKFENVIAQSNSILNADDQQNNELVQNAEYVGENIAIFEDAKAERPGNEESAMQNYGIASSFPADVKNKIVADFDRSFMANLNANDSMTYHTKEAHKELNLFTDQNDSDIKIPIFEAFEIREDHSITMAATQAKIGTNVKKETNSIDDEKFNKNFGYEIENKRLTNVNEIHLRQENLPQNHNLASLDDTSTQIFTFNVPSASTPCNNRFKKPQMSDSNKPSQIQNFNVAESNNIRENFAHNGAGAGSVGIQEPNQGGNKELYPILETTQEYRLVSSSSGSNQTTGNTMFGYTTRESTSQALNTINEKNQENATQESFYHQYHQDPNAYVKRQNGVVKENSPSNPSHRNYNYLANESKAQLSTPPVQNVNPVSQYHTLDHQYHKTANAYNQYNMQRNVPQNYQVTNQTPSGNVGYQQHVAYNNSSASSHGYHMQQQNSQMAYHPHAGYQNSHQTVQNSSTTAGFQSPPHVMHGYQNSQTAQHGFQSPQPSVHGFTSPQHGFTSPQHGFNSPQQGFTSPQQGFTSPQQGFTSPQHGFTSPQQGFTSPQQGFTSPQHGFTSPQHVYTNAQQGYTSPQPGFTSPQHVYVNGQQNYQKHLLHQVCTTTHIQTEYQSTHAMQAYSSPHQSQNASQSFHNVSNPAIVHNQQYHSHPYHSQNNNTHTVYQQNQDNSYSNINQSPYNQYNNAQVPQHQNQIRPHMNAYGNYQNSPSQQLQYTVYKNPQGINNSTQAQYQEGFRVTQEYSNDIHSSPNQHIAPRNISNQNQLNSHFNKSSQQSMQYASPINEVQKPLYQSPTAKLRSVRHEVPHVPVKYNNSNVVPGVNPGFSNQYLNFITSRKEPKDNANTPKFGTSPNISQKMHKNLYVSSPEQAQMPPNSENIADVSKTALHTSAANQSHINLIQNKYKDQSKRQLDFDHRTEIQSEDSRESAGRMLMVLSRQSMHNDSLQMDVDSENSMDNHGMTFKSNCSNSMISTQDIPMPANIEFPKIIDPFKVDLCNLLLQYVKFPNRNHCDKYYELKCVPKLQLGTPFCVEKYRIPVEKQLGRGTFGSVFKGFDNVSGEYVALKYQKPGHPWEFYICREIKARVDNKFMLSSYMDITAAFIGDNASVFLSELSTYGSLLDVANKVRASTSKCIGEYIVMLMASEMLSILHYLHKAQIIHGDIKPDNFLVLKTPQTESRVPSLQLIDFGCAIDMSLFPEGTTFRKVISTDGFTCTEMRDGRPWTYQTDLFCLAGTVYVILMGNYMQTVKRGGQWVVEKKWPRYIKSKVWDKIFTPLLNVKDCSNLPDLLSLKEVLDEFLRTEDLSNQLRNFENILKQK